ncbi:MAG: helix-hairpin-helix domain-containing protein, partial [Candidatus Neomarinimicrobiota bacterium]
MKFFTSRERRILLSLAALLVTGLLAQQIRRYLDRPDQEEMARRTAALEAFAEGSRRFKASADSTASELWALGLESPVDVNHAGMEELQVLPGIGPVLAKKIIDYRRKNGYFQTAQELVKVKGIGPILVQRWEAFITA